MAPIRLERPVSTATDLTDYTHATDEPIEADVCPFAPPPAPRLELSWLTALHSLTTAPSTRQTSKCTLPPPASPPQQPALTLTRDTESLTESVKGVVHEYGRTYQQWRAGAYPFPNDETEYDRLGWQHLLIKCLLRNRNWFAPIKSLPHKHPKRVLDIGCGTGQWCREIAKEFPRSRVEGIDLSKPPQKYLNDSPENLHFNMDDIRHSMWWDLANDYTYDYIHTRMSLGIYPDFREIIQKSFNNLEPGGFMESQELDSKIFCDDGTMPSNWPLLEWSKDQNEAAHDILGRPLRIAPRLKTWYEQAGFVDVKEEIFRIPINAWAKDPWLKMMGVFMAVNMRDGLYGFSVNYFHRAWGWTVPEIRARLVPVYDSLKDNSVHAYFKVYVVHGRKPRKDEPPSDVPKPDHWPTKDNCYNDKKI